MDDKFEEAFTKQRLRTSISRAKNIWTIIKDKPQLSVPADYKAIPKTVSLEEFEKVNSLAKASNYGKDA